LCYNVFIQERELIKQVITVHHKRYATGLFWQPVNVGVTPYIFARQLISKSVKKYTLLTEYKSMIGLSEERGGVRAGMPSAAAEIVSSLSAFVSFLAVFNVDNYYYLVAVRNGVIIRDILIETEAEARKLYVELSEMPDWSAMIAPSSWGMPQSQEKAITNLIRSGSIAKLRQISIVKSLTPSIVIMSVFLVLVLLFVYVPSFKKETPKPAQLSPELMAEYQKQIQAKNEELDKKFEIVKPVVIRYPYDDLPDVMERARLCYKAIGYVMQPIIGWNQRSAKCDKEYVSAVFSRGFGTLNDFYVIGADLLPGASVTQRSENDISVSVKLPKLKLHTSLDERDQQTALRDIYSVFQQVNIRATVRVVNDSVKHGSNNYEKVNAIRVEASSKLIPVEFMQVFNDFDGVYMESVSWDFDSKIWKYNVLVYTK